MRAAEIYGRMATLSEEGEAFVLATIIAIDGSSPRPLGAKMLVLQDGSTIDTIGGGVLERAVAKDAADCLRLGEPRTRTYRLRPTGDGALGALCEGDVTVFLESHAADRTLLIVGAGHIAQKLAPMAKQLDFRVVVLDSREEYATAQRFPDADGLIVDDPGSVADRFEIRDNTHIVIVTHSHTYDTDALRAVVGSAAAYVGMIGSKRKVRTVLTKLEREGVAASELSRVHSPIGLDLGGKTPAEISVSILAEIVASEHGKLDQVKRLAATVEAGDDR